MTVKEAAKALEISPALVYALCAANKIRHERHGLGRGTIRITKVALEQYRRSSDIRAGSPSSSPRRKALAPASDWIPSS